jgi:hypothetical protein
MLKSFKQYIKESQKPEAPCYVMIKNGRVELRKMDVGGPITTFAPGAVHADITGNIIVVQLKNGKTVIYKVNPGGRGVTGPYFR